MLNRRPSLFLAERPLRGPAQAHDLALIQHSRRFRPTTTQATSSQPCSDNVAPTGMPIISKSILGLAMNCPSKLHGKSKSQVNPVERLLRKHPLTPPQTTAAPPPSPQTTTANENFRSHASPAPPRPPCARRHAAKARRPPSVLATHAPHWPPTTLAESASLSPTHWPHPPPGSIPSDPGQR